MKITFSIHDLFYFCTSLSIIHYLQCFKYVCIILEVLCTSIILLFYSLPRSRPQVKHYHIKKDQEGNYYLSHNIKCPTIPELIYRHQLNPAGLCTRLRPISQGREAPTTAGLGHGMLYHIDLIT